MLFSFLILCVSCFFSGNFQDLLFNAQYSEIPQAYLGVVFLTFILLVTQWDFHSFSSGTCSCIMALIAFFLLFPPFSISGTPNVGCWSSPTDPLIFSSFLFCCLFLCLVILLPRIFPHLLFSNPSAEIFILTLSLTSQVSSPPFMTSVPPKCLCFLPACLLLCFLP